MLGKLPDGLFMGLAICLSLSTKADQLIMNVVRHVAQRYGLGSGESIEGRLRGETIHLMPG